MNTARKAWSDRMRAAVPPWVQNLGAKGAVRLSALAGVVVAAVCFLLLLPWPDLLGGKGLILLETPQVFTRGRLVNDRAAEQAWLEAQLKRTDALVEKDRFAKPDYIKFARRNLTLALGTQQAAAPEAASAPDDDLKKRLATVGLSTPPIEQFEDAARYREAVRNQLMSTVLDDRHDIEGNTIYRLNFNVTVLPPRRSDRLAMVVMDLSQVSDGEQRVKDLESAYIELLHDWRDRLRENILKLITDRWLTIEYGGELEPVENQALQRWLGEQTRAELARLLGVDEDKVSNKFIDNLHVQYGKTVRDRQREDIRDQFRGDLQNVLWKSRGKEDQLLDSVIFQCSPNGEFDSRVFFRESGKDQKSRRPSIHCTPPQRLTMIASPLVAKLEVLDSLRSIGSAAAIPKACLKPDEITDLAVGAATRLPLEKDLRLCQKAGSAVYSQRQLSDLSKRRKDLISMFVVKYVIEEKAARSDFRVPAPDKSFKGYLTTLRGFFKVGPYPSECSPGSCVPEIQFAHDDLAQGANRLIDVVGQRATAFTYAVMPNKTIERSELGQRLAGEVSGGADIAPKVSASSRLSAESETLGMSRDPTIMGFGDWGRPAGQARGQGTTKLGWVMFPRVALDPLSGRQQVPESYSVSAMVSLPGWWKTAHVAARTCWVSESALQRNADPMSMCPESESQRSTFDFLLPGDTRELMQFFRFEVLRTPYIDPPMELISIEAGRSADVLVRGGRLWRTPVVNLWNQKADRIEVLPDMQGIIAHFNCVLPEPGTSGAPWDSAYNSPSKTDVPGPEMHTPVRPAPLNVTTSEGVTQFPMRLNVKPFTVRTGEGERTPCWLKVGQ